MGPLYRQGAKKVTINVWCQYLSVTNKFCASFLILFYFVFGFYKIQLNETW